MAYSVRCSSQLLVGNLLGLRCAMLSGVSPAVGAGAVERQEAVRMGTPEQSAKRIYADATRAALDAITRSGRGDIDALVPIIAADAAVLSVVRGLFTVSEQHTDGVLEALQELAEREQITGGAL